MSPESKEHVVDQPGAGACADRAGAFALVRDLERAGGDGPRSLHLSAAEILPELIDLALRFRQVDSAPVELHLALSPAEALAAAPTLARAARILSASAHRLTVGLAGPIAFAAAPAGAPAWRTLRALRALRGLALRWPEGLSLAGGSGFLAGACSPPANDDDRIFDLAVMRHFGLFDLADGLAGGQREGGRPGGVSASGEDLDVGAWPACCARARLGLRAGPDNLPWLIMLRRCQTNETVEPGLDPFRSLAHVPCSFGCAASREAAPGHVHPSWAHFPVLYLLDRRACWLELIPEGALGRRFAFSVGRRGGDDPRLEPLLAGGDLHLRPGRIEAFRAGRRVAYFPLTAGLFSLTRVFDARFWTECALERLLPSRPVAGDEPPLDETRSGDGESSAAAEPVLLTPAASPESLALRDRLAAAGPGGGLVVREWRPSEGRQVTAVLEHAQLLGGQALHVFVEPAAGAGEHYMVVGDLALSFSDATPLDTAGRRSAFRQFAAWIKRID